MSRLYLALAIAAAIWASVWWHQQHAAAVVRDALQAQREQLQAAARIELLDAQVEAHQTRARADGANLEMIYAIQQDRDRARGAAARADAGRRGLLGTIAALQRGEGGAADGAGARSLADAAPQLARALGECSGRYVDVAGVADQLAIQVIGLQRYITEVVGPVCVSGQAVEGQ